MLPNANPGKSSVPSFGSNRGSAPMPGGASNSGGGGFFSEFDFENASSGFQPLDAGWYDTDIFAVEPGYSRNGHKQLAMDFKVATGPMAGRQQKYWLVITPNSLWKVKQFFEALGVAEADMSSVTPDSLRGSAISIKVEPSKTRTNDDGVPYMEVVDFRLSDRVSSDD